MCLYAVLFLFSFQRFLIEELVQLNVLYAFKKYRVSSLHSLSVCVVCARLFSRSVFSKNKRKKKKG